MVSVILAGVGRTCRKPAVSAMIRASSVARSGAFG